MNYRSVSLITVVAKLYRTAIKDRWVIHFDKFKGFTLHIFSFREGGSCGTKLPSSSSWAIEVLQERYSWVDYIYLEYKTL